MIGWIRTAWDRFRGAGDQAVTVPPMDGALRPNTALETAVARIAIRQPDNLVPWRGGVALSSGADVLWLDPATGLHHGVMQAPAPVTALAALPDGGLAIGLASGGVLMPDGQIRARDALPCPVALLSDATGRLIVANGSARNDATRWKHDLMAGGATGSVLALTGDRTEVLASGLAWPQGLAETPQGLVVSESWRHRLVRLKPGGGRETLLPDLPGYPARLTPAAQGWWLAIFAPRGQLIEFVLRQPAFRDRMMAEIDPDYWVAPSLFASNTFLEPLQGGAQKHLGVLKPWAPTRSYGLAVRLDAAFRPVDSYHSRADGRRHGITSIAETAGHILIASRGGDLVLELAA